MKEHPKPRPTLKDFDAEMQRYAGQIIDREKTQHLAFVNWLEEIILRYSHLPTHLVLDSIQTHLDHIHAAAESWNRTGISLRNKHTPTAEGNKTQ